MASSRRTDDISPELLKQARRRTRDQLGADIEGKATDEFCVAFGISQDYSWQIPLIIVGALIMIGAVLLPLSGRGKPAV